MSTLPLLAANHPTRTSFSLLSRSVAEFLLVVMKHKQEVKGEDEDTLEARVWKGKRWDICSLERGTKAASSSKVWAPTDITPIKEEAEQTSSSGKEQRQRITQRDEDGRREGCRVNVWNESSGGRGKYGTHAQSEQGKNKVFLLSFFPTEKRLTRIPRCFQKAYSDFFGGVSRGLTVAERETVANLAISFCLSVLQASLCFLL